MEKSSLFAGNYISYHGPAATGVSGEIFNASVAIDGNSPVFVTQVNQAPATITYNNQIFSSPTLSDGNHTLVITAMNDHPLYIDYLLVSINPSASIVTSTSTQPSTIHTTSPEPSASKASSISIGAIIGGSVGGLIFFTALVFAVLLARRHRQRSRGPYGRRSFIPAMNSQWRVSEYPPDDPGLFSTHPLLSLPPSNSTHSLVSTQTQFDPTLRKERPPPQYST
ncbi:hypothetical protein B0H10DRAFT_2043467 [Mycena sp. CBHHK59/15]|nr:hypothetical protein B0H10DRAFT_2043467 [Mycena sp. CBHHK59/15]